MAEMAAGSGVGTHIHWGLIARGKVDGGVYAFWLRHGLLAVLFRHDYFRCRCAARTTCYHLRGKADRVIP